MLPRWALRPVITLLALPALVAALGATAVVEMHTPLEKRPGADTRTTEQKIAIAMSAGPLETAEGARIINVDTSGRMEVLRDGANGFTCLPGHGDTHPPVCADQPSM